MRQTAANSESFGLAGTLDLTDSSFASMSHRLDVINESNSTNPNPTGTMP